MARRRLQRHDELSELRATLEGWRPPTLQQEGLRQEYLAFLSARGPAALSRDGGPEHVTGSCFLFSADLRRTLLCFHRKGRFWVQTGGHVEPGDGSVAAAALREAYEESGLTDLAPVTGVLDLDRHDLSTAFGRCRTHWDVGFVALAPDVPPRASAESEQVGWFDVEDLPTPLADRVRSRTEQLLAAVRERDA